ncbi:MAG: GNAT family N-acetyltransferase [Chloroflexi bacterium]|nr:GNAT family N-acetyltransferase [Chloroflexota bacterium]
MQTLIVTNYQPGDEAWMFELQRKTLVRCPDSALMDPVSYRDPAFEQGLNIFCAFEGDKRLVGYGWIRPHRVLWLPEETLILPLDVRVDPDYEEAEALRQRLLDVLCERAHVLRTRYPQPQALLAASYYSGGRSSIDYLLGKGFRHYASDFSLRRDLRQPLPERKPPAGVELRSGRLQTAEEQQEYLKAFLACEKESWTLDELREFLQSELWGNGMLIAGYAGTSMVGGLLVYYDPDPDRNPDKVGRAERLFVLPSWRGRGLGRCMLYLGLRYLQENGMMMAELQISALSPRDLRVYETSGFYVWQETVLLGKEILGRR